MDYQKNRDKTRHRQLTSQHRDRHRAEDGTRFKYFMSEFIGTFIFVFLSQASLTSFEFIGTQSDIVSRHIASIATQSLAFLLAALLSLNLSGAHLNPAYSMASALYGHINWGRALNFMLAQYSGSLIAAIFLHATYLEKINNRHFEGLLIGHNSSLRAHGNILSTGKMFASHPPTEISISQLFASYTLATATLSLILLTIHQSKSLKLSPSTKPAYLAIALALVQAAFFANGGPVLNPAQDFAPRLYISLMGWGRSAFNLYNYNYWWLCGIIAPHFGAVIGFGLIQILSHLNQIDEPNPLSSSDGHYSFSIDSF